MRLLRERVYNEKIVIDAIWDLKFKYQTKMMMGTEVKQLEKRENKSEGTWMLIKKK